MKGVQIQFLWKLVIITGIVFGLHIVTLHFLRLPLFEHKIILAYILNTAIALLVFNGLYIFREKFKKQLGFLFLFGSMLKFILFFLFFNGSYKMDGTVTSSEFAAFFVPYMVTLIIEVYSLTKWLNKLE